MSCRSDSRKGTDNGLQSEAESNTMSNGDITESNVERIGEMAYAQMELGKTGLDGMPERILFLTLRDLYRSHRDGSLSLERCKDAKLDAVKQYRLDCGKTEWYANQVKRQGLFWQKVECAATNYAMSDKRTAEADDLYNAVYGQMPSEPSDLHR